MIETDDYSPGPCPRCGTDVSWTFDCPGYPTSVNNREVIMVCQPCSNASLYECPVDGCGWWYRNPNNREAPGMGEAPIWPMTEGG